ncbi:hypothetical protein SLS55_000722 [Diplodia seriata]|uniref:Uncharacterized protein n=1 Tax=Diplodia seriata TaxID=420778 RepID=A0ABR3CW30_9PEZI
MAQTTAFITPPSSIPVAPMLSTITTTANATAASNNGLGTAGPAGPATPGTAGAARSQKPAFPNSARKRNATGTTTTNATANNNSNNRRASAATAAVHGQLALPGASGERGTNSNGNGVGGRHHYRGGGIIRSQLAMSHNSGGMRRNGGGAMPMPSPQPQLQLPLPSPQLSLLSTLSLPGNVVGMSAENTAAALRGGGEGEREQGEEEEVQKEKEEEGKTRPEESGGKTGGKDPYGMFMKDVVEYAGND